MGTNCRPTIVLTGDRNHDQPTTGTLSGNIAPQ